MQVKSETGGCRGREEALGNHGAPLGISSDASKGRPLLLVSFPVEYGLIKSFKIKSVFGDSEERPILLVSFFCGRLIDLIGVGFFKGIYLYMEMIGFYHIICL